MTKLYLITSVFLVMAAGQARAQFTCENQENLNHFAECIDDEDNTEEDCLRALAETDDDCASYLTEIHTSSGCDYDDFETAVGCLVEGESPERTCFVDVPNPACSTSLEQLWRESNCPDDPACNVDSDSEGSPLTSANNAALEAYNACESDEGDCDDAAEACMDAFNEHPGSADFKGDYACEICNELCSGGTSRCECGMDEDDDE